MGIGLVALFQAPILDAIVALLAGLNIMWTGFGILRGAVGGLMDMIEFSLMPIF